MSVIAWDGYTIAADKQATVAGLRVTTTKLRRICRPDCIPEVIGYTGDQDSGMMMAKWYEDGADPAQFPECQKGDDWSRLTVADKYGVRIYERQPVAVKVEDLFAAWGSGRDFAMAAMHLGQSARDAVVVASQYAEGCGRGVDSFDLT